MKTNGEGQILTGVLERTGLNASDDGRRRRREERELCARDRRKRDESEREQGEGKKMLGFEGNDDRFIYEKE